MSRVFNEEAKIWAKYKKNTNNDAIYKAWREEYKRKGIIEFAYKELRKDPKNGGPLQISDEQKEFLEDIATNKVTHAIISAGRGCLAEGSLIQMADGSYKPIEEIKEGDIVVSLDDNYNVVNKEVIGIFDNGYAEVFEFKNSLGGVVYATADHQFLSYENKNNTPEWNSIKRFNEYRNESLKSSNLRFIDYDVDDGSVSDRNLFMLGSLLNYGSEVPKTIFKCSKRQIRLYFESFINKNIQLYKTNLDVNGLKLFVKERDVAHDLILLFNRLCVYPDFVYDSTNDLYIVHLSNEFVERFYNKDYHVPVTVDGYVTRSVGEKHVYDIMVNGGQPCFVVNGGFVAHNCGKSFALSIIISWFIFVCDYKNIAVLAGNAKQSGVIDEYIKGWIRDNPKLETFVSKNVNGEIKTFSNSGVIFCALSDTAVRGIHGSILVIDEEVAAEEAGGEAIVKTAEWTVNTAQHMVIIRSCYDKETEVLTKYGWKYFKNLTYNDEIATFNQTTKQLEYQKPTDIMVYPYKGKMYKVETNQIDLKVTPEHKMFVKHQNSNDYLLKEAKDIAGKTNYRYKKNCEKYEGDEVKYFVYDDLKIRMDDWLAFFGVWLNNGVIINKNNKSNPLYEIEIVDPLNEFIKDIKVRLEENNINTTYNSNRLKINNKQLWLYLNRIGKPWKRYIPQEIKSLSLRQLRIFFYHYIKSSRINDNAIYECKTLVTSIKLRDDLQEIALKLGISANYYEQVDEKHLLINNKNVNIKYKSWIVSFITDCNEPYVHEIEDFDKWVDYDDNVYCVTVPNHVIYVRRNGKPVWSSNSTPQSSGGYFIETWNEAEERGYKCYQWSSVKHISGEKNPYKIYEDTNPEHWFSNLPWITDISIRKIRRNKSNSEWLSEALGTMSLASGLVINPADMEASVCDECEECYPYQGKCILLQYYLFREGLELPEMMVDRNDIDANENAIKSCLRYLGERVIGIDWGAKAPDCYTCIARYNNQVFILDSKELFGQGTKDKIDTAVEMSNKWHVETVIPDPEQWAYSEYLNNVGFTVQRIWTGGGGQDKQKFVAWLKKDFERHRIHIPKAYKSLIKSISELTYGEDNKIVKRNDHSFDSLLYGRSYFGADDDEENVTAKSMDEGTNIWQPKQMAYNQIGTCIIDKSAIDNEDFNPFDIEYLKKRRKGSTGFESGVDIW